MGKFEEWLYREGCLLENPTRDQCVDAQRRAWIAARASEAKDEGPKVLCAVTNTRGEIMWATVEWDGVAVKLIRESEAAQPAASMAPCKGMNCGCTDGVNHSLECHAEHAAAIAGGTFKPAEPSVAQDERGAFEHIERASNLERDDEGDYVNPCVQSAWEGFQQGCGHARAASTPANVAQWADWLDRELNIHPVFEPLYAPFAKLWEQQVPTSDMKSLCFFFYRHGAQKADVSQGSESTDDIAVDSFAREMKAKMAQARENGRRGWEGCDPADLSRMLREHVEKGDPRDVANFCMMLWHHSASISRASEAAGGEPVAWKSVIAAIAAVEIESSRRGEMFPQTSDEQREDRKACERVREMIRWYATNGGACIEQFKGWPRVAAPQPASEQQAASGLSDDVRSRLEFYAACYCKSASATDREAGKAMYALLAAKGDGHAD